MNYSDNAIRLIKKWEGLYLKSYLCPANVATIGYGTIRYPDGKKVELGQEISIQLADSLLRFEMNKIVPKIQELEVNQNQFDSVVSFIYNLGIGAFNKSELRKKILANPNDLLIRDEWNRWNKHRKDGKLVPSKGLTNRRSDELKLYYLPIVVTDSKE